MLLRSTENLKFQVRWSCDWCLGQRKLDLISAGLLGGGDQREGNSQGQSGQKKVKM